MKFSEIAGHEKAVASLRSMVDSGRVPHAILLSGISGIGKFRLARAFAQYLHCRNRQGGDSCGKCPSCLQHMRHNNPDLHFTYPVVKRDKNSVSTDFIEEWKEMLDNWSYMPVEQWSGILKAGNSQPAIYVDESDAIVSRASLSAYQEDFKVFLVWMPEKLRPEAANKLLKVIEEPFEDTVFVLVSNDDSKILPTISSRTQRFNLRPVPEDTIERYLRETRGLDAATAYESSRIAEGSIAKAEELACHPEEIIEFSSLFKETMRMAYALKATELKRISDTAAGFGREKLIRFLNYSARMVRENFISNLRMPPLNLMTSDEEQFSQRFAPFIHEGNVEGLLDEISRATSDIERNANTKIVMFDLLLLFSQLVRTPKPSKLPL